MTKDKQDKHQRQVVDTAAKTLRQLMEETFAARADNSDPWPSADVVRANPWLITKGIIKNPSQELIDAAWFGHLEEGQTP